jgi:alcohol dehydrogenase class IV
MADLYCREGIARAGRSLLRAYRGGAADPAARGDMAFASLMGGLALANAGLGAVHGFAGVVGGMFPAPHGAVCAALLPAVVAANARALADQAPQHPALERYAEIAQMLTGESGAGIAQLVDWLRDLRSALGIPGLAQYGLTEKSIPAVAAQSAAASSMKANPITLSAAELIEILDESL